MLQGRGTEVVASAAAVVVVEKCCLDANEDPPFMM